jgi:hypothetical protein
MNNSDLDNSDREDEAMEDETIEDDVQEIKFTKKNAIILGIIMVIVYIGLHFKIAHYDDDSILCFSISPLSSIIFGGSAIDAWVVFEKTIQTEWGTITLKPFCKVRVVSNRLSKIDSNNKNADYDFLIFGNKISPTSITFSFSNGTYIDMFGKINIGEYNFDVEYIYFYNKYDRIDNEDSEDVFSKMTSMAIVKSPKAILLSCGAEVSPPRTFEDSCFLTFENSEEKSLWYMHSTKFFKVNFDSCSIKDKNQESTQLFNKVTFEPNWGAFISGEVYDD